MVDVREYIEEGKGNGAMSEGVCMCVCVRDGGRACLCVHAYVRVFVHA